MIQDIYPGAHTVKKDLHPKWTVWRTSTVSNDVKVHRRRSRRAYKQYLLSGDIRQFIRSQKFITRWDFD